MSSKLNYNLTETTYSTVSIIAASSLLASIVLASVADTKNAQLGSIDPLKVRYNFLENRTYSELQDKFTGEYVTVSRSVRSNSVRNALEDAYKHLLENQEPLGQEFERVLYANLWNLYVDDKDS